MAKLATEIGCGVLETAHGVIQTANEHMVRALRVISVERGYNPADYTLLCFGGAGGLHACDLAELLHMTRVIIPARSGVLSALGMLVSEPGRELSQAVLLPLANLADKDIGQRFKLLEADARVQLLDEGCAQDSILFQCRLELRYEGQSATISIDWSVGGAHEEAFHRAHATASGLRLPHPVELVNIRLSARAPAAMTAIDFQHDARAASTDERVFMPGLGCDVRLSTRHGLEPGLLMQGPLILVETAATTWIKPGWAVKTDIWDNLLLQQNG